MSQDPCFDELMARLRKGDQDAATEIFNRFTRQLITLARSRLDQLLRQKLDPEDVLQSVYRSFFDRHAQGQYDFQNWDTLWGILTLITIRKCGHRLEYYRAACRDIQREIADPLAPDITGTGWDAVARDPTPAEAAQLTETIEQLMAGLTDRERDMVSLRLQGHTAPEISTQVGRTERTVQRVLQRVKKKLVRIHGDLDTAIS
ncbi:MAG TPA: sigma-70 family RNA polymerase sigma factor [Gemmataceae bacterium]|jgi:RNA polymerase sigma-70 factor (ECF subfamily)|nr:sigma-70 family RNA polymerase sigma factor [Gemmataceae bacterium]